jgi:hypothetical protein
MTKKINKKFSKYFQYPRGGKLGLLDRSGEWPAAGLVRCVRTAKNFCCCSSKDV